MEKFRMLAKTRLNFIKCLKHFLSIYSGLNYRMYENLSNIGRVACVLFLGPRNDSNNDNTCHKDWHLM